MIEIVNATLLERKEDFRMFDDFSLDPSDPVAYMIYKDVMEDDDEDDEDNW